MNNDIAFDQQRALTVQQAFLIEHQVIENR